MLRGWIQELKLLSIGERFKAEMEKETYFFNLIAEGKLIGEGFFRDVDHTELCGHLRKLTTMLYHIWNTLGVAVVYKTDYEIPKDSFSTQIQDDEDISECPYMIRVYPPHPGCPNIHGFTLGE